MNVYDAIMQRRTIRKFEQRSIDKSELDALVDCARFAAYPANVQPLKFMIIDDAVTLNALFPLTKWAGALPDGAPKEKERPVAYIAILGDRDIKKNGGFEVEAGAAVTTMMLAALDKGIGSCWLGAIDRGKIKERLSLAENLDVVYLLALGYGAQKSRAVEMKDGEFKYFESEDGTINVPKRAFKDIVIK